MYEQSDLALIGSRIKAVRTGKGMSQADLAVKASVSLPLISNIERGKTRMQLETFVKVLWCGTLRNFAIRWVFSLRANVSSH